MTDAKTVVDEDSEGCDSTAESTATDNYEVYEDAIEKAEQIVNRQVNWFMQTDRSFGRIFRFNILVLGGFLSVLTYGVQLDIFTVPDFFNPFSLASFAFWMVSTTCLVVSYGFLWAKLGLEDMFHKGGHLEETGALADTDDNQEAVDATQIGTLLNENPSKERYYREVLGGYVQTMHSNEREVNSFRFPLYYGSILLLLDSIVVFAIGLWATFSDTQLISVRYLMFGGVPLLVGIGISLGLILKIYSYSDRILFFLKNFWR